MIENFSYLLPLFIPIYYQLPLEYYIGFFLFTVSNFFFKKDSYKPLYRIFQFECFIFLYSLYIFHNVFISYLMVACSLFDYNLSEGILSRSFLFFSTFFLNYSKNPLLCFPFIYLIVLLPSYITGNILIFTKSEIIQYNMIQTVFFFLCYQKTLSRSFLQ